MTDNQKHSISKHPNRVLFLFADHSASLDLTSHLCENGTRFMALLSEATPTCSVASTRHSTENTSFDEITCQKYFYVI